MPTRRSRPGASPVPLLLGDDRLVIAKVVQQRAAQAKPLTEVREAIVAALTKEQASQAALKAAEAAREKLQSGTAFEAVLQELKVSADPAHYIGRRDPSVQAQVREAVFAMPSPEGKPAFRALALNDGGAAVVAVTAVRTAPAHDPKGQTDRAVQEAQNLGAERGDGLRRGSAPHRRRAQESQGLRIARQP